MSIIIYYNWITLSIWPSNILLLNIYRTVEVKHARETMSLTFKNPKFNYLTNPIYDQQSQTGFKFMLYVLHLEKFWTTSSIHCISWYIKHLSLLWFEFWMLCVPNFYSSIQNSLFPCFSNYCSYIIVYLGWDGQFSL